MTEPHAPRTWRIDADTLDAFDEPNILTGSRLVVEVGPALVEVVVRLWEQSPTNTSNPQWDWVASQLVAREDNDE